MDLNSAPLKRDGQHDLVALCPVQAHHLDDQRSFLDVRRVVEVPRASPRTALPHCPGASTVSVQAPTLGPSVVSRSRQHLDVAAISVCVVSAASMDRLAHAGNWVASRIKERVVLEAEAALPDDERSLSVGFQEQAPVLLNQDALHDRARSVSSSIPRGEEQPFFHRWTATRCRQDQSDRQAEPHSTSVVTLPSEGWAAQIPSRGP